MERRNKIICFSTTQSMADELRKLAPSRDSLSQLLREIIQQYLQHQSTPSSPQS